MSDLIAVAYPDRAAVDRAEANLRKGMAEGLLAQKQLDAALAAAPR